MKNSKLHFKIILFFIFCFLFSVLPVYAARLYFESPKNEYTVGEVFPVSVMLDTEGEEINAVDIGLEFLKEPLVFDDFSDGGSVISLWVNKPSGESPKLCGVIPGGISGPSIFLGKIYFKALKEGIAILDFSKDSKTLVNDGKGTEAELRIANHELRIMNSAQSPDLKSQSLALDDNTPPEVFEVVVARDESIFDGRWFLSVAGQDKESGMGHYEIVESRNQKIENEKWERVESPYVLKDQSRESYIHIKAVDRSGNERISVVPPLNPQVTYTQYFIWGIIIIAMGVVVFMLNRQKKKVESKK